jgi:hypothetical protein
MSRIPSSAVCVAMMLAAVPAAQAATAAVEKVPGTVSCVMLSAVDSSQVIDDKTIIFKMRGKKYYKNTLPYSCPRLGSEKAFSYKTSINQLCSVDIITVLETGGGLRDGASCGLGKFEPYTPPEKVKK